MYFSIWGCTSWAATGAAWISPRDAHSWGCGGNQCSWWADRRAEHHGRRGKATGGLRDSPLPREKPARSRPPPLASDPGTPRKEGELCLLEVMRRGVGEPESWLMDCSPPPAAWELPPPLEGEARGELGSLEEVVAKCTELSPVASSLGSWADECEQANECERADAALPAAEAQMGRGCAEESPEGDAALDRDLLMEEDSEWMVALKAALAPRPPGPAEMGGQPKGRQGAPKPVQGPPPTKGSQKKPGLAPGKGTAAPTGGEAATQGATTGKKPHRPSSLRGSEEDEIQVVKVQPRGVTLPMRVKERPYE